MKLTSDAKLPPVLDLGDGRYQFSYNQQDVAIDDRTVNEFDHIQLPLPINRDKLIAALIEQRYSKDTQIAILFNKEDGTQQHREEYVAYQAFREEIKNTVDSTLKE